MRRLTQERFLASADRGVEALPDLVELFHEAERDPWGHLRLAFTSEDGKELGLEEEEDLYGIEA